MAQAQKGPSHHDAKPIASDSEITAATVPGTMVPAYSNTAPRPMPIMGTTRRPDFAPLDRVTQSEIHPPSGIMIPIVRKMMVVYVALRASPTWRTSPR